MSEIGQAVDKKETAKVEKIAEKSDAAIDTEGLRVLLALKMNMATFQTGTSSLSNSDRTGEWLMVTVMVTPQHKNKSPKIFTSYPAKFSPPSIQLLEIFHNIDAEKVPTFMLKIAYNW